MKKIPIILLLTIGIFLLYYLNQEPREHYYSGAIENRNAYIGSKVGGRVEAILKNEGDRIQKGEIILTLNAKEQALRVASLQAKLTQVKLQHQKILHNSNHNPKDIAILQAQIEEVRANLDLAKLFLDESNITAPCSGVVERIAVEIGDIITPNKGIVELSFPHKKYAKFYIPETKLTTIAVGDRVEITVDGTKQIFEATISSIAQNAEFTPKNIYSEDERENLLFGVKAKVEDQVLKSGMMIKVRTP